MITQFSDWLGFWAALLFVAVTVALSMGLADPALVVGLALAGVLSAGLAALRRPPEDRQ